MFRFIGVSLVFFMVFSYSAPAMATTLSKLDQEIGGNEQEEPNPTEAPADLDRESESWMVCHQKGKVDGGNVSSGGSGVAGFAGGVLLGLIGTGLVVLLQGDSDPKAETMVSLEGDDCKYAYIEAYQNQSLSKKRKSALIGGLIGTAILVALVVSSSGD